MIITPFVTLSLHFLNYKVNVLFLGYIMGCGWAVAITLAQMPQYGISDFRKFAICLPFEIGDSISLGKNCMVFFKLVYGCAIIIITTLILHH